MVSERPGHQRVAERVVWYSFGLLQVLLALRLLLLVIYADRQTRFARMIYRASEPFVAPLRMLILHSARRIGGEAMTIAAMLVLLALAWVIVEGIHLLHSDSAS